MNQEIMGKIKNAAAILGMIATLLAIFHSNADADTRTDRYSDLFAHCNSD